MSVLRSDCSLFLQTLHRMPNHLIGLVVRRPPRESKVLGLNPTCAWIFSGSSHTCDLNIGTPVATLPGACRYRVSAGTGQPGVSILWLGEMWSLICDFYLSVAARKIVCADPTLRYTRICWDIKQPTNKQTIACQEKEREREFTHVQLTHNQKVYYQWLVTDLSYKKTLPVRFHTLSIISLCVFKIVFYGFTIMR